MKRRCTGLVMAFTIGILLFQFHVPIPFMLGGILTASVMKFIIWKDMHWPVMWRNMGLIVAGYGIGRDFTQNTLLRMSEQMVGVFGAAFVAIGISIIVAWFTYRHTFANLISCVLGMMPGGLNQMMLMADEDQRVDANVVIMQQIIRLFGVLVTIPFLAVHLLGASVAEQSLFVNAATGESVSWLILIPVAGIGAFLAKKIKMPTSFLIGPIIATAVFSITYNEALQKVPPVLMNFAQMNIGLYMGCMLDKDRLFRTKRLIPYALGGTVLIIGGSVAMAQMLSAYYGLPLVTAFLAMAPGGVAEMCLAGMSMGADVSLILTYQIVRMFIINLIVPYIIIMYFDKNYTG